MKFSVLTTLLALCLLAFAANVNSKSIEVDSAEVDNIVNVDSVDKSAEENKVEPDNGDSDSKSAEENKVEPDDADSDSKDYNGSKSAEEDKVEPGNGDSDSKDDDGSQSVDEGINFTDSTEAPETTPAPEVPESTEAPEAPESTEAPEAPESTEAPEAPESTEAPSEVPESTIAPDSQEPDQVKIEELHKYVKDLMFMVEQMMNSAIDTANELTSAHDGNEHTSANIEEVRRYVIDIISMLEQNMMSIINVVSNPLEPHDPQPHHPHPHEPLFPGDDIIVIEVEEKPVPIQPRTINTLWWILKSVLKTLRGVNCTIKAVVNVKESTEQMLANFQVCGVETTKQIQAVLDSAQKVLSISNDIMNINENVCDNADYMADVDASQKTSSKCVKQLRSQVRSLNKQISTTVKLAKKVPTDAGDCVTTTFSNYQQTIVGFPDFVKTCAKL